MIKSKMFNLTYKGLLIILCGALFFGCKARQNEGQTDFANVNLSVENDSQRERSPQFASSVTIATALIVAVPESVTSVNKSSFLGNEYDKALLNLTDNTVSLSLPLNVPLRLMELTFTETYNLDQIATLEPTAHRAGLSAPVTINEDSDIVEILISLSLGVFDTAIFDADVMGD